MKINKVNAVVTGGGSGLGEGTAKYLKDKGANIFLIDVNEENLKKVSSELDAEYFVGDVSDPDLMSEAIGNLDNINCLVNCAGIAVGSKVVSSRGTHDLGLFEKVLKINLLGSFNLIRLCADKMQHNTPDEDGERGVIINTASVAAFDGQIGQAAYSASKGGIVGMTLPVARDLSREGIRVNTILPGLFDTPLFAGAPDELKQSLGAQIPFPSRLGYPKEYGSMARHICENEMLNGESIRLDGAIRMAPK